MLPVSACASSRRLLSNAMGSTAATMRRVLYGMLFMHLGFFLMKILSADGKSGKLLRKAFQFPFCLSVAGVDLQQLLERLARSCLVAFDDVNAGQVQVRRIVGGRQTDGVLKALLGLLCAVRPQVQDSQIVEGFGIGGTRGKGFL